MFGASSGGIVALELLTRHPAVERTLTPFEPAAVLQLPDGQKWVEFSTRSTTSTAIRD